MTRYRNVNGVKVPFTAEEETSRDVEEVYERDSQRSVERTEAEELAQVNRTEVKGLDRAILRALFELENRVRALESKPPLTLNQMRAWIKNNL